MLTTFGSLSVPYPRPCLNPPYTKYIMKARKSCESLEQNIAETIAQYVDNMNVILALRLELEIAYQTSGD